MFCDRRHQCVLVKCIGQWTCVCSMSFLVTRGLYLTIETYLKRYNLTLLAVPSYEGRYEAGCSSDRHWISISYHQHCSPWSWPGHKWWMTMDMHTLPIICFLSCSTMCPQSIEAAFRAQDRPDFWSHCSSYFSQLSQHWRASRFQSDTSYITISPNQVNRQ